MAASEHEVKSIEEELHPSNISESGTALELAINRLAELRKREAAKLLVPRREECIEGSEARPITTTFDALTRTFQQWKERDPSDERFSNPQKTATNHLLELEVTEHEDVIRSVLSIMEERLAFNLATLDVFGSGNPAVILNYLKEYFGVRKSEKITSTNIQLTVLELKPGFIQVCSNYKGLYEELISKTRLGENYFGEPLFLEVVYDTVIHHYTNIKADERATGSLKLKRAESGYEISHFERIIEKLKPFLSPAHPQFKENLYGKDITSSIFLLREKITTCLNKKIEEVKKQIEEHSKYLSEDVCLILLADLEYAKNKLQEALRYCQNLEDFLIDGPSPGVSETEHHFKILLARKKAFYAYYEASELVEDIQIKAVEIIEKQKEAKRKSIQIDLQKAKFQPKKEPQTLPMPVLAPTPEAAGARPDPILEEKRIREQKMLDDLKREQEISTQEAIAFKKQQEEKIRLHKASVQSERDKKALMEAEKREKFQIKSGETKESKDKSDLAPFEVEQLIHLGKTVKSHQKVFDAIFEGGEFTSSDLNNFITALFFGCALDKPRKLFKFNGSSHFKCFVPRTSVPWQINAKNEYVLSRSEMNKIDSWRFHSIDGNEIFTPKGRERCLTGFINAGLTPNRLKRAEVLYAARKGAISMRKP